MAESTLITLIKKYDELRETKERLAEETKQNNQELKDIQEKIVDQMIEDDIPSQGVGDYTYTPQIVTHYSFKSAEKLVEMGVDKIQVMRENGFGFLIKEEINQRSLESTMKDLVKNEEEGIPEEVEAILNTYDEFKVSRRKASGKGLKEAKKSKGE
jgi:single-stranded DNA-specific DHH superfamily exonuclease